MTKQFWTLKDATRYQTTDDIMCPLIRTPQVGPDRKPVFKGRSQQFVFSMEENRDYSDFQNWLKIENHKAQANKQPEVKFNKRNCERFIAEHPEYKLKLDFRPATKAKVA